MFVEVRLSKQGLCFIRDLSTLNGFSHFILVSSSVECIIAMYRKEGIF